MHHFDDMGKNVQTKLIDAMAQNNEIDFIYPFFDRLILNYPMDIKIKAMANLIKIDLRFAFNYMNHENESIRNAYKHIIDFYL